MRSGVLERMSWMLCICFVHGPISGTVEHCGVVLRFADGNATRCSFALP